MSAHSYLEAAPIREIARYAARGDYERDAVLFSGTARKHPYDREKLLLVPPQHLARRAIYEFRLSDILHAEDTSNIVSEDGESLPMVNIWVRKGSFGVVLRPFEVGIDRAADASASPSPERRIQFSESTSRGPKRE